MGFQSLFLQFVRGQMNGFSAALVCWTHMTEDLEGEHVFLRVVKWKEEKV